MLDNLLIICAVLTAVGAIATVFISNEKQRRASEQRQKDTEVIRAAQTEMLQAQLKYELLNEKYKNEIVQHQNDLALLNQKFIAESRQRLAGQMLGVRSKPLLRFYQYDPANQMASLYWSNAGEDAAHVIVAVVNIPTANNGERVPIELDPIIIPAKTSLSEDPIRVTMIDRDEILIDVIFKTLSGSYVELLVAKYDGNVYREAYELIDARTKQSTYFVDQAFPVETSKNRGFIERWQKAKSQ